MMFVILCYDIGIKRNAKVHKTVKKYLRPVQKSVCEGFITEGKLKQLCGTLKNIMDPDEDSIVVYKFAAETVLEKLSIGQANVNEDFII